MQAIPCLYLPYQPGSSKLLIYFHGNAEDIGLTSELLDYVRSLLRVSLIILFPSFYFPFPNTIVCRSTCSQWNTQVTAFTTGSLTPPKSAKTPKPSLIT